MQIKLQWDITSYLIGWLPINKEINKNQPEKASDGEDEEKLEALCAVDMDVKWYDWYGK
jgi:hypothetical protein